MASYSMGDLKKGLKIEIDGVPYKIVEYQHVKPGKGAAFVRAKIKSFVDGKVLEKTFHAGDKCEQPHLEEKEMQYLYDDGEMYNFMNNETFEQIALSHEQIADSMKFVKENETVKVVSYQGNVFSVEPPLKVILEVTHTEPGIKGNTTTGATKPATVETGVEVQVPLFVNIGDKIIISTQTGDYESRA